MYKAKKQQFYRPKLKRFVNLCLIRSKIALQQAIVGASGLKYCYRFAYPLQMYSIKSSP